MPLTVKSLAAVAFLVVAALLVWHASNVFLVLFAGGLFAVFLRSIMRFVKRYSGLRDGGAFVATVLFLLVFLGLFGWLLAARVAGQMDELVHSVQSSWDQFRNMINRYEWMGEVVRRASDNSAFVGIGRVAGILNTSIGAIGGLALAVFVGAYIAFDPETYRRGLLHLVPIPRRSRVEQILSSVWESLHWWLLGQLVAMSIIGVGTTIGLFLLGVPMALALGLIAFLLTFIPYIGPILSAVPAVLVGLASGPWTALYIALLYIGLQSVESYFVTPMVQQRSVRLPPALTLANQALMGFLFGIPGLIVATPTIAALLVVVRMRYVEDALGDLTAQPED